jgi:HlyD family secretion protein
MHKVWTKEGNIFKAHKVEVGTTNGILTEITGGITEGTEILVDFSISGGSEMPMGGEQQATNPFMPRPRGNNNRNGNNNQQRR